MRRTRVGRAKECKLLTVKIDDPADTGDGTSHYRHFSFRFCELQRIPSPFTICFIATSLIDIAI